MLRHKVFYSSLYNTGLHNEMKVCKLVLATQITEHIHSLYPNIHEHSVGIFTSSSSQKCYIRQLWLYVIPEHQCYKHRAVLSSSSCSPALSWLGTWWSATVWSNMLWWRQVSVKTWDQQSVFMLFWPAWFHPFPFPVTKPYPEAAINQEGLAWLFFHLDGWKMVSKFAAFYPKHPLSSPMMTTVFLPRISATKPEKMTVKKNKQT